MKNVLADLPERHYKTGVGIYSICSAHPVCLEAAAMRALWDGNHLLVEATSNQVDQFGGYTGMTPAAFRDWVITLTGKLGLAPDHLILGGDHLGPNPWRKESAAVAMDKARELVRQYAAAGFSKIHLDCSMALGGDAGAAPSQETVAERAADLCQVAEIAAAERDGVMPVYVIGTEVPIPGGATHDLGDSLAVTRVDDAKETLETHRRVFAKRGLEAAWERVIALVVQPGVEFGNYTVVEYDREKARDLSAFIADRGDILFEAHSTDYQLPKGLTELVKDHYAILKVGPWLTYAYREALFGLSDIARELGVGADIRAVVEQVMLERPDNWQAHYHGAEQELKIARAYSYSDRIRYYWPDEKIQAAIIKLQGDLESAAMPLSLVSQYLPRQYDEIREGRINPNPQEMLKYAIVNVITFFSRATNSVM